MTVRELRLLRAKCNISLLELAAHSGLTESYLTQIEEETIPPSNTDLARIEKAITRLHKMQSEHVEGEIDE